MDAHALCGLSGNLNLFFTLEELTERRVPFLMSFTAGSFSPCKEPQGLMASRIQMRSAYKVTATMWTMNPEIGWIGQRSQKLLILIAFKWATVVDIIMHCSRQISVNGVPILHWGLGTARRISHVDIHCVPGYCIAGSQPLWGKYYFCGPLEF